MSAVALSLLSGLSGALIVFFLGVGREWWRNDRERLGLLRLLLAEVERNAEVVTSARKGEQVSLTSADLPHMKLETWRAVRGRVAQLAPRGLTETLNNYYSALDTLLTLLALPGMKEKYTGALLITGLEQARGRAGTRNPYLEYAELTFARQDQARKRLTAYLDLTWWRRLFGG